MSTQWEPRSFLHRISDGDKSWSCRFLIVALIVYVCVVRTSAACVCVCLDSNLVVTVNQILFRALQHPGRQKQGPQPARHSEVPFTQGTKNILRTRTASQPACQKRLHTGSRQALWTEDPTRRDVVLQSVTADTEHVSTGGTLTEDISTSSTGVWEGPFKVLKPNTPVSQNFHIRVYFTATAKKTCLESSFKPSSVDEYWSFWTQCSDQCLILAHVKTRLD